MLIIAIPKSASTSLLETLGGLHFSCANQIVYPENPIPDNLSILNRYHSDIRNIDSELVEKFACLDILFKQHVPPTLTNIRYIGRSSIKPVILVRNPIDIIESYYRAQKKKLQLPWDEFHDCHGLDQWKHRAVEIGLKSDLDWFFDRWTMVAKANNYLVINFDQLVSNPTECIKKIEEYWGFRKINRPVILRKERYSGHKFPVPISQIAGKFRRKTTHAKK